MARGKKMGRGMVKGGKGKTAVSTTMAPPFGRKKGRGKSR